MTKNEKKIKKVNPKSNNENDTLKIVLLYMALIFLIIMLFIPPILRLVIQEKKEEKPKIVLSILNCSREKELIVTAYQDNNPYNFYYSIKGDHTLMDFEEDENNQEDDEEKPRDEFNYKNVIRDITSYSSITYNEMDDKTEISMDLSGNMVGDIFPDYSKPIDEQSTYYERYGFTCTKAIVN